ncbi:plasmid segregation oscillating ATPase ParF (plasmid) [Thalassoporum mexicanum PCC 7367]|uniref:nucleotide-binding protein n=1 Tax=Thalassoporum mexicanum TaxID=3457544 RepID=UPI00029FE68C|nr:AAA family ATPase [Pseudanabaena sp. PCC 7367]AFY71963.1 plasmid segregation oscillating ATPase ParF [Pseudanabaena sp. PCC 7367]
MILVCGGTKGGVGKSTIAISLTILRAAQGKDVLLVDADDQGTASDFTAVRNETLSDSSGAGYTSIKLHGAAVRTEVQRLAQKYDDIMIDVGGRDTTGQRAALSIADIVVIPFLPASFDIWALEIMSGLLEEAHAFNDRLKAIAILNRADPQGKDNQEAAAVAKELKSLTYLDAPLGNRKAFRNAASQGLSVTELRPKDAKAIKEITNLYEKIFSIAN